MHIGYERVTLLMAAVAGTAVVAACSGGGSSASPALPPVVPPAVFTVGGTVSGLSGSLSLQNNAGSDLTITANGPFVFAARLPAGASYDVTIRTQPATAALAQDCIVSNGNGTLASGNVASVLVTCTTTAINGIAVPPDPGAAGEATVAGIDADSNGIRDDIDIFIATKYGADGNALKGARISARAHQNILATDPAQTDRSRTALQDSGDAGICAGIAFRAAGLNSSRELIEIFLHSLNTADRLAHKKQISASAGLFERSVTSAVCP